MPFQSAPFPTQDAIVDGRRFTPTQVFIDWVTSLTGDVDASPARLGTVAIETQSASVGSTAIPLGALSGGYYRVTTFARITRAATSSSSLTVTIGFTSGGVSCTFSTTALTGNTTATVQSHTWLLLVDASTPVTYSTTYASSGATTMEYQLAVIIEQVQA